ncbi:hypothetical protein C4D60_Mb08t03320 [Musa balbisiana]|uniref:Uncharacterized protein n=1 Tax=Musa balbisiana TaxID=52838 RepID=A0A4S8K130_MUSBA|nr:hypothetical protein C4D60_Mb08t03320 [Musa balbisiana]
MVSGPLIGWMIVCEWYLPAFGALIVSGATDRPDGILARKMDINSVFGSYLDPIADNYGGGLGGSKRCVSYQQCMEELVEFANLDATQREKVEPLFISWLVAPTTIASAVAYGAQHLCG